MARWQLNFQASNEQHKLSLCLLRAAVHHESIRRLFTCIAHFKSHWRIHQHCTTQKFTSILLMRDLLCAYALRLKGSCLAQWQLNHRHQLGEETLALSRADSLLQLSAELKRCKILAAERVCRNIVRHWVDRDVHRLVRQMITNCQRDLVASLMGGMQNEKALMATLRHAKVLAGLKASAAIFQSWKRQRRAELIAQWHFNKTSFRRVSPQGLRLLSSIYGRWRNSTYAAVIWQWLFNYQCWQVAAALQAQRAVMSDNLISALDQKAGEAQAILSSKDREIAAHIQAAKWEAMQLQETRDFLDISYRGRGIEKLDALYSLWRIKVISRAMRKWTGEVCNTKVENAIISTDRHRLVTNLKAGMIQLAAIFDAVRFRRFCVGFYCWLAMMPEEIPELAQLPIKPYKALGNRVAHTKSYTASTPFKSYKTPAGIRESVSPKRVRDSLSPKHEREVKEEIDRHVDAMYSTVQSPKPQQYERPVAQTETFNAIAAGNKEDIYQKALGPIFMRGKRAAR